jgi:Cu(I)/Ag(I) efflux system membrane fusion protein
MNRKLSILYILTIMSLVMVGCTKTKTNEQGSEAAASANEDLYYCPMHPQVHSPHPGVCPICHMTLVKKQAVGEDVPGVIELTASQEITANVITMKTESRQVEKEITGYSVLDFAENGRKTVSAKFNGRVEQLFASVSGAVLKKGAPLFSAYSAEVYQTMSEYINAAQRSGDAAGKVLAAARLKLQLAGLSDAQIHELDSKKDAAPVFTYYSPFAGTIVEKKVQEGSYFSEGTALYELVDMSRLWNIVEVNESDAEGLRDGMQGQLIIPALQGKGLPVRISLFYPSVNKQNRTVKIRTELLQTDKLLKPQMYGETKFKVRLGQGVLIPEDAILFTGKRQLVYVKSGERKFVAREIQIGSKVGDHYLVTSGLQAGEEIAISGGYLLDSESQLRSGRTTAGHDHSAQHGGMAQGTGNDVHNEKAPVNPSAGNGMQAMRMPRENATEKNNNEHNMAMTHESAQAVYIDKNDPMFKKMGVFNKVCPVLGEEISAGRPTVLYKGRIYGFCCSGCDKKFVADPEKYVKNLSKDGATYLGHRDQ